MMSFAKKSHASVSILAVTIALGGCATKLDLEAPYDELSFEKALPETDPPAPVQVVEVPKVLPLPGQLKPWPDQRQEGRAGSAGAGHRHRQQSRADRADPGGLHQCDSSLSLD